MQCLAEGKVWNKYMISKNVVIFKREIVTRRAQNLASRRKMPYRTTANHAFLQLSRICVRRVAILRLQIITFLE